MSTVFNFTFVPWFRAVAPHIHLHRGKTFVVAVVGEAIAAGKLGHIATDLALIQSMGVKIVLVSGAGGVGSAIAASIAAAGAAELMLYDFNPASAEALATRLRQHYPQLTVHTGANDPAGFDVVVNATPLGMKEGDPLPFDVARIAPRTFVGEVVMKTKYTPLLQAAIAKGCPVQVGTDMLFEQIPAYLEFFGWPGATAEDLRRTAQIAY